MRNAELIVSPMAMDFSRGGYHPPVQKTRITITGAR